MESSVSAAFQVPHTLSFMWNLESSRGGISLCQVRHPGDICLRTVHVFRAQQSLPQWPQFPLHPGAGPLPVHSTAVGVPAAQQDFWSRITEAVFAEQQLISVAVLYQGGITCLPLSSLSLELVLSLAVPALVFQGQARALAVSVLTCALAE